MNRPRLFLLDDEPDFCDDLEAVLGSRYNIDMAHDAETGLRKIAGVSPDVVLLDVEFEGSEVNGVQILERIRALDDPPPVIMLSGRTRVSTVVEAMKLGAFHYVIKPADPPELFNLIERALVAGRSKRQIQAQQGELGRLTGSFICGDDRMFRVLEQADTVAGTTATVMITGESGTGKEMIARRVHEGSNYSSGPFVGINCSAFPADLIESEIFGHSQAAFTGAKSRIGKLELAAGGTFFMDEVGEAPLDLQVKLLRALGEKMFVRLGENVEREVRCRIVAATSRDLTEAITDGTFREDLYYRLNIYRIKLPALRQRPGDVMVLARHFLDQFAAENARAIAGFSPAVEQRILQERWSGNVRELRNFVERAVINCRGGLIGLGDMFGSDPGLDMRADESSDETSGVGSAAESETISLKEAGDWAKDERERQYCRNRLREAGGNVSRAAEASGVLRQSFQRKLRDLGVDPDEFKPA